MNHIIKKVAVITVLVFIFALAGPVVADLALDTGGETVIQAAYDRGDPTVPGPSGRGDPSVPGPSGRGDPTLPGSSGRGDPQLP